MADLTHYFPKEVLDLCWDMRGQVEIIRGSSSDFHAVQIGSKGPLADVLIRDSGLPEEEISPIAMAYQCLGDFMAGGPVIIKPSLDLCLALHDTEIRVSTTDFLAPFPIIGVELPQEVVGRHAGSLTMVWKMFPDAILIWTCSKNNGVLYHTLIGDDLPTIEDRLIRAEGCDDEDEYNLQVVGGRIAANLCMLAAARPTNTIPLPRRTAKHRDGKDERLKRLAGREIQTIVFRNLLLKHRPSTSSEAQAAFTTRGPQHRRGHWRRVVHGPKRAKRSWRWINDYCTGDRDDDSEKPMNILYNKWSGEVSFDLPPTNKKEVWKSGRHHRLGRSGCRSGVSRPGEARPG